MEVPHVLEFATKSERVAFAIRNKITLGEYRPGQRLPQQQLALELGVSETPVREALNQLRAEGLVVGAAHHGARVVDVPLRTVQETCLIRLNLERLAVAEGVSRMGPDNFAQLAAAHQAMVEAAAVDDRITMIKSNRAFHFAIYMASEMPQLVELIRMMWSRLPPGSAMFPQRRVPHVVHEHAAVLEALRAGERASAAEQMESHVRTALDSLLRAAMRQPTDQPVTAAVPG